ncbi:MAG: RNA polymerase sigma factor [Lawsonibacter sp.]|jgi:RNA polymerase sigma factor (sigma-70 family)
MFDRKSDYALNKQDPDSIVCKSSTGVHIRLTRLDFASPEEFEAWKKWSDEDYHEIERQDHIYHNHTLTASVLAEIVLAAFSPEEEVMDRQDRMEREQLYRAIRDALETQLTPAQRRRLWLYAVDGLTEDEIASKEQVRQQSVSKRINAAKKILRKVLKRWV